MIWKTGKPESMKGLCQLISDAMLSQFFVKKEFFWAGLGLGYTQNTVRK
jgi:hypothetical protein